jgi:prolyl oligopeptidase
MPDGSTRVYPRAPQTTAVDRVRGVRVRDPYRPLEHMHAMPTRTWVTAQNRLTSDYLSKIPEHKEFTQALQGAYVESRRVDQIIDNRLFYAKGVGQEHALICSSDLNGEHERVLLDPNELSVDGHIAVDEWTASPDGKWLAYAVRRNGSDELEWRVRNNETGQDSPERLHGGRYGADSISWNSDSTGFSYERYRDPGDAKKLSAVVRYAGKFEHKIGTPQSADTRSTASHDKQTDKRGNRYSLVGENDKVSFYQVKGPDYPRGAICTVRDGDELDDAHELVGQRKDTLQDVTYAHGQLFAHYLQDAHSRLARYDEHGKHVGDVELPGLGTLGSVFEASHNRIVFQYSTATRPSGIYSYNLRTGSQRTLWEPKTPFNPDDYETQLVMAPSKDGTKVPLFVTHRKDVPLDGRRPTYLYGYGGFDSNQTPTFDWTIMPWLDKGGVYVRAALRGGGEYGEKWHEAGMRMRKQNVFNDFIGAGEWLVKSGVTSPQHLSIGGASNGGLLVAATELQRPDLFGAAVPNVAVTDMMRFPKFTGGFHWIREYGETSKPGLMKKMLSYSPVHNIKQGRKYPATLVMTGDHDDRVVPAHSYKFAAELQQAQGSNAPVLLRTTRNIGHGFGMPLSMRIDETANRWAFLWHHTGV